MGASCAGSAPGALSTAGPLSVRWAPLLPRRVRRLRCLLLLPAPLTSDPAPTSPAHSATGPPIPSVGPQAQTLLMRGSVVRSHHGSPFLSEPPEAPTTSRPRWCRSPHPRLRRDQGDEGLKDRGGERSGLLSGERLCAVRPLLASERSLRNVGRFYLPRVSPG